MPNNAKEKDTKHNPWTENSNFLTKDNRGGFLGSDTGLGEFINPIEEMGLALQAIRRQWFAPRNEL